MADAAFDIEKIGIDTGTQKISLMGQGRTQMDGPAPYRGKLLALEAQISNTAAKVKMLHYKIECSDDPKGASDATNLGTIVEGNMTLPEGADFGNDGIGPTNRARVGEIKAFLAAFLPRDDKYDASLAKLKEATQIPGKALLGRIGRTGTFYYEPPLPGPKQYAAFHWLTQEAYDQVLAGKLSIVLKNIVKPNTGDEKPGGKSKSAAGASQKSAIDEALAGKGAEKAAEDDDLAL